MGWGRIVCLDGLGHEVASWPLACDGPPDLAMVDTIARLQLGAHSMGGSIRLEEVAPELAELLDLVGLRRQFEGEAEEREDVLGVEEGVDPGDPLA